MPRLRAEHVFRADSAFRTVRYLPPAVPSVRHKRPHQQQPRHASGLLAYTRTGIFSAQPRKAGRHRLPQGPARAIFAAVVRPVCRLAAVRRAGTARLRRDAPCSAGACTIGMGVYHAALAVYCRVFYSAAKGNGRAHAGQAFFSTFALYAAKTAAGPACGNIWCAMAYYTGLCFPRRGMRCAV